MPRLPHARGANSENFKNSGGGGVNSSDLIDNFWRSLPHKNHNCRDSIEIPKGGSKETFLNLVLKISFGPPFEIFKFESPDFPDFKLFMSFSRLRLFLEKYVIFKRFISF
jgi:hypothetical protein